jgi:hypothetical protein
MLRLWQTISRLLRHPKKNEVVLFLSLQKFSLVFSVRDVKLHSFIQRRIVALNVDNLSIDSESQFNSEYNLSIVSHRVNTIDTLK